MTPMTPMTNEICNGRGGMADLGKLQSILAYRYEELSSAPTRRLSEVWKRSASGLVSVQERASCDDSCGKPYDISECLSMLPSLS